MPDAKIVPREPTVEMLRVNVVNGAASDWPEHVIHCSGCLLGAVWSAMYDAAPEGDLVARLMREWSEWEATGAGGNGPHHLLREAADAIAALRSTLADINDALRIALGDDIEGMERERIEDLASIATDLRARAERAEEMEQFRNDQALRLTNRAERAEAELAKCRTGG